MDMIERECYCALTSEVHLVTLETCCEICDVFDEDVNK